MGKIYYVYKYRNYTSNPITKIATCETKEEAENLMPGRYLEELNAIDPKNLLNAIFNRGGFEIRYYDKSADDIVTITYKITDQEEY